MGVITYYDNVMPHGSVAPYIRSFYRFEYAAGGRPFIQNILPSGTPELFFVRGDAIELISPGMEPMVIRGSAVFSQLTSPVSVRFSGDATVYGIAFKPFGLARFFGADAGGIGTVPAPGADALPGSGELFAMLAGETRSPALDTFSANLETRLLGLIRTRPTLPNWLPQVLNAMSSLSHELPTTDFFYDIGLSKRSAERVFLSCLGCSPKSYLRVARFTRFLKLCEAGTILDMTTLAVSCGYYDHSHLCHEVKAMSGKPPSSYVRRRNQILGL